DAVVNVGRGGVEEGPAHVVAGDGAPARGQDVAVGAGQQLHFLVADLGVGEPRQVVVDVQLERTVGGGALATIGDGAIGDGAVAAAIGAAAGVFRQHRGVFVQAGHRRAAVGRRGAVALGDHARQASARCR